MKQPDWTKVAEVELIYKTKVKASERPVIKTSADAYNAFMQTWNRDKIEFVEEFKILLLNNANKVLGMYEYSSGNSRSCIADPKHILCAAIKANATSIILCHNHPSGNMKPSEPDLQLTRKVKLAGELLDLKVLDHLILTKETYYSFADEGIL